MGKPAGRGMLPVVHRRGRGRRSPSPTRRRCRKSALAAPRLSGADSTGVFNVVDDDPAAISEWVPARSRGRAGAKRSRVRILAREAAARLLQGSASRSRASGSSSNPPSAQPAELGWAPGTPPRRGGRSKLALASPGHPRPAHEGVGHVGLEPDAHEIKVSCSAAELMALGVAHSSDRRRGRQRLYGAVTPGDCGNSDEGRRARAPLLSLPPRAPPPSAWLRSLLALGEDLLARNARLRLRPTAPVDLLAPGALESAAAFFARPPRRRCRPLPRCRR